MHGRKKTTMATPATVTEIVTSVVYLLDNARSVPQLESAIAEWYVMRESYYESRCMASRWRWEYETRGALSGFGPGTAALAERAELDEAAFVSGTADAARSASRRLVLLTDRLVR